MGALGDQSWSRGGDRSELAPPPTQTAESANKTSISRVHSGPRRTRRGGIPPARGRSATREDGSENASRGQAAAPYLLATVEPGAFSCAGARLPPPGHCPRSVEESSGQGAVATWAPGRCLHGLRGRPLSRLVARLSSCASAVPSASPARPPGRGSARGSGFQSQARQETAGEDGAARPPRSICVHAATAS